MEKLVSARRLATVLPGMLVSMSAAVSVRSVMLPMPVGRRMRPSRPLLGLLSESVKALTAVARQQVGDDVAVHVGEEDQVRRAVERIHSQRDARDLARLEHAVAVEVGGENQRLAGGDVKQVRAAARRRSQW